MIRAILVACVLMLMNVTSYAGIDVYEFSSTEDRQRYQKFLDELRCPKCKNQNLAGTNSEIAEDLRRELRKMIDQGKSDSEIIEYMVSRYGDFVLYRPRFQSNTLALWLAPFAFVMVGVSVIAVIVMRRRRVNTAPSAQLSREEQDQLDNMLDQHRKR